LECLDFSSKKNLKLWAKRMSCLKKRSFGEIPIFSFDYFKEANECYVYGCFNGAIALAGTALELASKARLNSSPKRFSTRGYLRCFESYLFVLVRWFYFLGGLR